MSFAFFTHGAVALFEWGTPEHGDTERVIEHVARIRALGRPVVMVSYIPEDAPAPAGDVQREMIRRMSDLAPLCASAHAVFGGNGFFVAFKRSVLTGMLFAGKGLGARSAHDWRIHASFDGVIEQVAARDLPDLREVLKAFSLAPRHRTSLGLDRSSRSPAH